MPSREHLIAGPAGALQLVEQRPAAEATAVAVVCHPHPLRGGSLHNKIVHQLARCFAELGAVAVRFNFRGVGASEGSHDQGAGELHDLDAVVGWVRERWPDRPLWLAGFSFGGAVVLRAAPRHAPDWVVTVAPAVDYLVAESGPPSGIPWLLIQGSDDEVVPTRQVLGWAEGVAQRPRLALLDNAGHFFHGRLKDLRRAVIEAAGEIQ